ncbi:uncharacterized protein [Apostichopus japonicus]|uniref:uncharacterized protein isoform X2 n=1 Tax=Stichopus japonicus TaxID=307972 RepID=UPI003AB648E7
MASTELNRTGGTRQEMKSFWSGFKKDPSVKEMLLDTDASNMDAEELSEVLSLLPEWKGKRILELGGGIGRYAGALAKQAEHVTTVDFIAEFIERSKENNKNHGNIEYRVGDAMNLSFPEKSFDIVFSNALLMYLPIQDIETLKKRLLIWLKDDGYFFFRESCHRPSGNFSLQNNPTYYRGPHEYHDILWSSSRNGNEKWEFRVINARSLQCYVKEKGNRNIICWLLRKCKQGSLIEKVSADPMESLKQKLKSKKTILQLVKLLGDNCTTLLGCHFNKKHFEKLTDQTGQKVLDLACGTGSADLYIEEHYAADVVGVDSSCDIIEVAWEKKSQLERDIKICFEIGDVIKSAYPTEYFDVVYCGQERMGVQKKQSFLNNIMIWLKPGGKLFFYEFCGGKSSEDSEENYLQILKSAGFTELSTGNESQYLIDKLAGAKRGITEKKEDLRKIFTEEELKILEDDWSKVIKCLDDGEKKWSWFYGRKPSGF